MKKKGRKGKVLGNIEAIAPDATLKNGSSQASRKLPERPGVPNRGLSVSTPYFVPPRLNLCKMFQMSQCFRTHGPWVRLLLTPLEYRSADFIPLARLVIWKP